MKNIDLLRYALNGIEDEIESIERNPIFSCAANFKDKSMRLERLTADHALITAEIKYLRENPDSIVDVLGSGAVKK